MDLTTRSFDPSSLKRALSAELPLLGLALLWSRESLSRAGEVMLVPPGPPERRWRFGRGASDGLESSLELVRQRPGFLERCLPLQSNRLSRTQLLVSLPAEGGVLKVQNVGRLPLFVGGKDVKEVLLHPGDLVTLGHELIFMCVTRPTLLPELPRELGVSIQPFGEPDGSGMVGETPELWELRRQIAFLAPREAHLLIRGASGTGKELVARAVHALSPRARRPLISRNAATIPEGLIDAELFGNLRNYPNPGTPERAGLIGEANGSTLFLDEIGELPHSLQAHLLRVLDQGEYQRLGEAQVRRADLRFIGATNRLESALKHDLLARLNVRIQVPDLNQRREDIPLIVRHLMRRVAANDPLIARRFLEGEGKQGEPRLTPELMDFLLRHTYSTHVRELKSLLWQSMTGSPGSYLELVPGMGESTEEAAQGGAEPTKDAVDPLSIPPEVIQACLDKHGGRQQPVCQELGLQSRFVLFRLIKRYGLVARRGGELEPGEET